MKYNKGDVVIITKNNSTYPHERNIAVGAIKTIESYNIAGRYHRTDWVLFDDDAQGVFIDRIKLLSECTKLVKVLCDIKT